LLLPMERPGFTPVDVAPLNAFGLNWTPSKGDGDEEKQVH
jgi:hypothetical protein